MRFRVLGDLEIGVGTRRGTVTAPRERILLALLLLRRGQTVPIDELIDAVWPEDPPRTARAQVHTCVSRLRQTLHSHDIPPSAIVTERFGYRMVVADTDLDAAVFTRLITRARAVGQSGDPHAAQESYRAALDLWRSTSALPGLGSPAIEAGALVLDEQRLSALEELADIELRTGGGRGMISELTGWVERFPYRERLRAQLMLALTQDGRQAEALELYRRGRQLLADELGMEPGTELRAACHRVLTGDRTGTSGGAAGAAPERPTATRHRPRYLPRGVIDFAGRAAELATVLDDLEKLSVFGAPAAAVAVDGMPGVGKTTFALALAQKAADRYPDGELFIDLHGDGASPPVTVDDALGTLLRQLGVPADRVPADTVERAARWRSEVEHRALFVLLDNAADSAQVEPLLPGRSGSVVVITSRRRLVGLDAVRSVTLEPLTETEAVDLLVRVVRDRALVDPDATAALAHLCGGLPLALRLAGARLAHRPTWQVAGMVQRLGGVGSAAAGLAAAGRSVAGAFDLSYRQLEPAAQRTLTRLALHPAGAVGVAAAAALANCPSRRRAGTWRTWLTSTSCSLPRPTGTTSTTWYGLIC